MVFIQRSSVTAQIRRLLIFQNGKLQYPFERALDREKIMQGGARMQTRWELFYEDAWK